MKRLPFVLFFLLPLGLCAEGGFWTSVSVEKSFQKKWSIGAEADMRANDNLNSFGRASIGLSGDYKFLPWLKVGAGYSFIADHSPVALKTDYKKKDGSFNGFNLDEDFWRNKHRAVIDLTGKIKAGNFSFALRDRYQFTHFNSSSCQRTKYRDGVREGEGVDITGYTPIGGYYFAPGDEEVVTDDKGTKNTHMLRSRVSIDYNIPHFPLTPEVSYEITNDLCDGLSAVKQRVVAGFDLKITKKFYISAAYVYQHQFQAEEYEPATLHAGSLGFKFKL